MTTRLQHLTLEQFRHIVTLAGAAAHNYHRDTKEEREEAHRRLFREIEELGFDGATELMAVMYTGRDSDPFARTLELARNNYPDAAAVAEQVTGKLGRLAEYLAKGMAELFTANLEAST